MCYQRELRTVYSELPLIKIARILNHLDTDVLWLVGGEVLLRGDLLEIIDYAAGRGWEVGLTTNGLLINEYYARAMAARPMLRKIVYSLDGPAVIHNIIRGSSRAFDLVSQAIRLTRNFTETVVNAVLTPITAQYLLELVEEVSSLGVSQLNVILEEAYSAKGIKKTEQLLASELQWQPETYHLAASNRIQSIRAWRSEEEWLYIIEKAIEQGVRRGVEVTCSSIFSDPSYALHYKPGSLRHSFQLDCANRLARNLRLDPEGRVIACGTIRKSLVKLPAQRDQVLEAVDHFFKELTQVNLLPVCARCCKVRVTRRDN